MTSIKFSATAADLDFTGVGKRNKAMNDTQRLDWLERHVVEVRDPLVHGSRHMFFAQDLAEEGEEYRNNIRAAIDEAQKESK